MSRFWMLLQREYWEHRGAFFWTPLVLSVMLVGLMLLALIAVRIGIADVETESMAMAADGLVKFAAESHEVRSVAMSAMLMQPATLIGFVLYVVIFFYLLGSLFDDRKDRSILFWKSLPVSDWETVVSKLLMALFVAPLIYTVFIITVQFLMLVMISVGAVFVADVPLWQTFWQPSGLHRVALLSIVSFFYYSLWWLPLAGWLMLASSIARRAPFLYAVIPPVLAVVAEVLLNWLGVISTGGFAFLKWVGRHVTGGVTSGTFDALTDKSMDEVFLLMMNPANLLSWSLFLGLIIGGLMIGGAILARRYYIEI